MKKIKVKLLKATIDSKNSYLYDKSEIIEYLRIQNNSDWDEVSKEDYELLLRLVESPKINEGYYEDYILITEIDRESMTLKLSELIEEQKRAEKRAAARLKAQEEANRKRKETLAKKKLEKEKKELERLKAKFEKESLTKTTKK